MVDGYATHLNARKDLTESGGGVGITPTFTDLMMWAVLAGQHELATVLRGDIGEIWARYGRDIGEMSGSTSSPRCCGEI